MMKKVFTKILKLTAVILLCFFSFSVSAQKLYFCKGYSETGEPKGVAEDWAFDGKGTQVVFLYNNGKTTFSTTTLFFLVENKTTGTSDKVEYKVAQNRNWDAMKYTFKSQGFYSVSVFGTDDKLMAKSVIKIGETRPKEVVQVKEEVKVNEEVNVKEEVKKVDPVETVELKENIETKEIIAEKKVEQFDPKEVKEVLYYDDIKVIFSEEVKGGKIVNEKTDFKMGETGAYVEVVLQSAKPLNTSKITVDIWKKEGDSDLFNEHTDEHEIKVDSKSRQVNFHRSFFKPGDYKISFFNHDNVWMTTGYVTISK